MRFSLTLRTDKPTLFSNNRFLSSLTAFLRRSFNSACNFSLQTGCLYFHFKAPLTTPPKKPAALPGQAGRPDRFERARNRSATCAAPLAIKLELEAGFNAALLTKIVTVVAPLPNNRSLRSVATECSMPAHEVCCYRKPTDLRFGSNPAEPRRWRALRHQ